MAESLRNLDDEIHLERHGTEDKWEVYIPTRLELTKDWVPEELLPDDEGYRGNGIDPYEIKYVSYGVWDKDKDDWAELPNGLDGKHFPTKRQAVEFATEVLKVKS